MQAACPKWTKTFLIEAVLYSTAVAFDQASADLSTRYAVSLCVKFGNQQFDYVLTVCDNAKESCPIIPGHANRLHHSFEDPAAKRINNSLSQKYKTRGQEGVSAKRTRPNWFSFDRFRLRS